MNKKFDKVFEKTEEKLKDNSHIDFEKSSVNNGNRKEKTLQRNCRIQIYLTESEFETFVKTLKPLEKPAIKAREIVIKHLREEKEKLNK